MLEIIEVLNEENISIPKLPSYEMSQSEVERLSNVKTFNYEIRVNYYMPLQVLPPKQINAIYLIHYEIYKRIRCFHYYHLTN